MDQKDLFSEVKTVPIATVIGRYVELRKKGSVMEGLCPFHADKHLGSFKVRTSKNRWNCYACGISGDATDFISKIDDVNPQEASIRVALMGGLITETEATALREGKDISVSVKERSVKYRKIPDNAPRDAGHCAVVYDSFVRACNPLSEAHTKHLKEVRRIKDEDMSLFFEWPRSKDRSFWTRFEKNLRDADVKTSVVEAIKFVPGFAYDLESDHPYFMNGKGIGLKLYDASGVLRGLQLRQDNASSAKYKLFSSGWAAQNRLEESGKFDGASAGQVPDIIFPKRPIKAIGITEGKFKALQLKRYGYAVLSVNGVNNFSSVLPEIISVANQEGIEELHIFYDADMQTNPAVRSATERLVEAIEGAGKKAFVIVWDQAYGKGIDDLLLAGQKKQLKKLSPEEWRRQK